MKKIYKAAEIEKALKKKGFVEFDTHHRRFFLYVDGRRTSVSTKLSHSVSEVSRPILKCIMEQMGFKNKKDFQSYVECHMSEEEYIKLLRKSNTIN